MPLRVPFTDAAGSGLAFFCADDAVEDVPASETTCLREKPPRNWALCAAPSALATEFVLRAANRRMLALSDQESLTDPRPEKFDAVDSRELTRNRLNGDAISEDRVEVLGLRVEKIRFHLGLLEALPMFISFKEELAEAITVFVSVFCPLSRPS